MRDRTNLTRRLTTALSANLVPARSKWLVEAAGAAVTAAIAYACLVGSFEDWWLWGMVWAAVSLALALHAAASLSRTVSRRRAVARARAGGCVRCGYPLRNLPSPRCPECGAPFIARRGT